tara:strand:+ start:300 stop:1337 length:1038 start_codon:yes stop_codon:yes gene_type:complete
MTNLNFDVDSIIDFPSLNGDKNLELSLEVRKLTFLNKKQKSYVKKKTGYNERFKVDNFKSYVKKSYFFGNESSFIKGIVQLSKNEMAVFYDVNIYYIKSNINISELLRCYVHFCRFSNEFILCPKNEIKWFIKSDYFLFKNKLLNLFEKNSLIDSANLQKSQSEPIEDIGMENVIQNKINFEYEEKYEDDFIENTYDECYQSEDEYSQYFKYNKGSRYHSQLKSYGKDKKTLQEMEESKSKANIVLINCDFCGKLHRDFKKMGCPFAPKKSNSELKVRNKQRRNRSNVSTNNKEIIMPYTEPSFKGKNNYKKKGKSSNDKKMSPKVKNWNGFINTQLPSIFTKGN